jgi:predicted ATPase
METEFLVQDTYKRLRALEERQSAKLRDSILLSSFQYNDLDTKNFQFMNNWKEKSGLLQRQKEIKEALSKIGVQDSKLSAEVDKFFSQLTSLFEQLSGKDEGNGQLKWLMNKAQIDRMARIVEIIDEHKSKVDDLFKPINDFLFTINDFYKDSNKKLEVDTVGQLVVNRPNGNKCTIEGLSSGERQLLVIFAHAFFNRHNNRTAFIIDEPELSLHLRWQEKFAETIFLINPSSQFILATHSPEIVGLNKNKAVKCR